MKHVDILCLEILLNFCSYGIDAIPLNDVIRHYEPVNFDSHAILSDHHRVRRGTGNGLKLLFRAFNRDFNLNLQPTTQLFSTDVVFESSSGRIFYDTSCSYTGFDEGDSGSRIFGVVTTRGHFEGQLIYPNETYNIEGSRRHFQGATNFSSIIYRSSDVSIDTNEIKCKSDELHRKMMKYRKSEKMREQLHQSSEKWSDRYQPRERKRRSIIANKTVCELYLVADHTFYNKFLTNDAVLDQITNHVQASNNIFRAIDFDGDGTADDISFQIKRVTIYDDNTVSGYPFPKPQYSVESLLDRHSLGNYDDYCLSTLFTYRDFEGVLGLAWTAEIGYAGGVCEKRGTYHGQEKNLNTGLVTLINYGRDVASAVSHATFAHEIGHNFGSKHDPETQGTCSPGSGNGGNYIMFPSATSGNEANNQMFSSCSIGYMHPILAAKARDADGCFIEPGQPVCGNNVVESGEECDCGWEDTCNETCCNPQSSNPSATPCTKVNLPSSCSPSEGPCCSPSCALYSSGDNHVCRANSSCLSEAKCDGSSAICPDSTSVANGTYCAEGQVCFLGECSGSVCLAHSLESCQCSPSVADDYNDEKLCEVCCIYNSACTPSSDIPAITKTKAVSGSPCNDYKGYCDVFHECRQVDPTGPLLALKKLLLDGEIFQTLKSFLTEHWYIGICAGVFLVIVLILVAKFCSKSHAPPKSARHNQVEDNRSARDVGDIDMYNLRRR